MDDGMLHLVGIEGSDAIGFSLGSGLALEALLLGSGSSDIGI